MVVFSMNSKRLRRPNVRLWEIGDLSAAFTCGSSRGSYASLGQKKWKRNSSHVEESDYFLISTQQQPEYTILDPSASPRSFEDIQYNRENKDPNSLKTVSDLVNSDEINMSKCKLDFGNITRRARLMKRRRRNPNGTANFFGDPWSSITGPQTTNKDDESYGFNQHVTCTSDGGFNIYQVNGLKDFSETETSAMSKEASKNEIEGTEFEENTNFRQFSCGHSDKVSSDGDVNSVSEWLEELGFGKFAKLFEMHEVDKEALPLLTFEDLKDMGIVAVGPRRKLFTAIQQLRGGR